MMTIDQAKRAIEAALFFASEPISIKELAQIFDEEDDVNEKAIEDLLNLIKDDYRGRGIECVKVATGYRFQICEDLSPWITRLMHEKPARFSKAMLETLALIAYKQPITRAEIEQVRGVAVSTNIMRTLQEREWIKVIGHRDVPGKPALYATTKRFLDDLNLNSLSELPTLAEIQDLDDGQLTQQLNLELTTDVVTVEPEVAADPSQPETDQAIEASPDVDELAGQEASEGAVLAQHDVTLEERNDMNVNDDDEEYEEDDEILDDEDDEDDEYEIEVEFEPDLGFEDEDDDDEDEDEGWDDDAFGDDFDEDDDDDHRPDPKHYHQAKPNDALRNRDEPEHETLEGYEQANDLETAESHR